MIRQLVLFILALNTIYMAKSGEFISKDDYQYYISYPLKLNWHRAFRYCTYQGMYLIDFHIEQEYNRVVRILKDHRTRLNISGFYDIWTSGTELGSEGQYFWESTGHAFQFTAWQPNEPNNWGNVQDCIALNSYSDFHMIDRECNVTSSFVCRNKLILADTLKNKNDACMTDLQMN